MDPARLARCVDKIDHAKGRLKLVSEWVPEARKRLQARLASYKVFQEASEAAADVAAMALVDEGVPAKDDYMNFETAANRGLTSVALVDFLREATSLRNWLVHEYDGVETTRAPASMERLVPALDAFFKEVERWLTSKRV